MDEISNEVCGQQAKHNSASFGRVPPMLAVKFRDPFGAIAQQVERALLAAFHFLGMMKLYRINGELERFIRVILLIGWQKTRKPIQF